MRIILQSARNLLAREAAGGVALMLAAALALVVANGPAAAAYHAALDRPLGPLAVRGWIDDGLMAVFFLLVGLETKAAFAHGPLAGRAARALPLACALGGMALPAIVYLAVVGDGAGLARGWAVPTATDIAFALGVLALVGGSAAVALRPLLTAIAVIDDIGAVLIIAIFYAHGLDGAALAAAAGLWLAMLALARAGMRRLSPYLVLTALLWVATLRSGIHPTIAGVAAALAIPLGDDRSPGARLERGLARPVAFGVLPLFGFANAGLALDQPAFGALSLAVMAGLLLGKPLGVIGGGAIAIAAGLARRPGWLTARVLAGGALLCGIGFTMSLFIGGLAFASAADRDAVKLGVLAGSALAALGGALILKRAGDHG